jgi:hypothetical protein
MRKATDRMQSLLTSLVDQSRVGPGGQCFRWIDLSLPISKVASDLEARKTMDAVVLDNIEAKFNVESLIRKLRIKRDRADLVDSFEWFVKQALQVARPKALYKAVYLDVRTDDTVVIDGVALKSRVLAVSLVDIHRVFAFVATCGNELAHWAMSKDDILERFWADAITDDALLSAMKFMEEHIKRCYLLEKTAMMSPGSLEDWPIQEQGPLFSILGDTERLIGVRLNETLMMQPVQSVSGILFPVEVDFATCQLCPRENCPKRRAPYDKHLYEKRFRQ